MSKEEQPQNDVAAATIAGSAKEPLPDNRFALELEFVQSLASPAYLHFLASNNNSTTTTTATAKGTSLLLDPKFRAFLQYLQDTWTRPDYSRFIHYPHALYFLDLLIHNDAFCRELAQVPFRNFCHQQQYYAWQNRFSTLYGKGEDTTMDGGGSSSTTTVSGLDGTEAVMSAATAPPTA